jgi:hypothetical protein
MSQASMMAAMDAGMASTQLMPSSTPPTVAMRGYDLGPVEGVKFDRLRNPLDSLRDVLRLLGQQ